MVKTAIATAINYEKDRRYQNFLIVRNYFPSLVAKQFQKVSQSSSKILGADSVKLATSYDPILPNINSLINKSSPILHADLVLNPIHDGWSGGEQRAPLPVFCSPVTPTNVESRNLTQKLSDVFSDPSATLV